MPGKNSQAFAQVKTKQWYWRTIQALGLEAWEVSRMIFLELIVVLLAITQSMGG